MGKAPRPFEFVLTQDEAGIITGASGDGGHQKLHRRLVDQLQKGNLTVVFNDEELGELVRYMTQYGSGGFQGRLYKAFIRSMREQLGL